MKGRKQHHKRTCVMLSEGKRTSMTYAGGTRNKRKLDKKGNLIKKTADAKAYSVGDYVWVFQEVVPPKGTKKLF